MTLAAAARVGEGASARWRPLCCCRARLLKRGELHHCASLRAQRLPRERGRAHLPHLRKRGQGGAVCGGPARRVAGVRAAPPGRFSGGWGATCGLADTVPDKDVKT